MNDKIEKNEENGNIDRRQFLKKIGGFGFAAAATALTFGYVSKKRSGKNTSSSDGSGISGNMTYRTNPNTGDKVSLLGYGFMRLPVKENKDPRNEEIDQETVNSLVDYAIAHGVNYFDTSPVYSKGLSEHSMGTALSRYPRNRYLVATKMSNFRPDPADRTREASIKMYHDSMKSLQVNYIDYYLLHAVGIGGIKDFTERFISNGVLDYLLEERKAGRIKNLGWSFHGDKKLFDHMLSMKVRWDFVQIQLNYTDWNNASGWNVNAEYLYGELAKRKIPAVIMEPLMGGQLAQLNFYSASVLKRLKPHASIASWAFRFAGSLPDILTVLSGMTYKEHLVDNLRTYSPLEPLSEKEYSVFTDVIRMQLKYPVIPCTGCNYCMPCPYGLNIPGIFSHYNKCVNEGNVPKNAQDSNYRKARRIFLVGYDRSVPKLRQADHCIGCSQCAKACPQHIKIPSEMDRINKFVEQLKRS